MSQSKKSPQISKQTIANTQNQIPPQESVPFFQIQQSYLTQNELYEDVGALLQVLDKAKKSETETVVRSHQTQQRKGTDFLLDSNDKITKQESQSYVHEDNKGQQELEEKPSNQQKNIEEDDEFYDNVNASDDEK